MSGERSYESDVGHVSTYECEITIQYNTTGKGKGLCNKQDTETFTKLSFVTFLFQEYRFIHQSSVVTIFTGLPCFF